MIKKMPLIITDEELEELLTLEGAVKGMIKRINDIRDKCKLQGSFYTTKFICTVKERTRIGIAPLECVEDALGRDVLEQHSLIRISKYHIIQVVRNETVPIEM